MLEQGVFLAHASFCLCKSQVSVQEGNKILSGGCDNAARLYDVTTGQASQVAQHDAPVKVVKWIETPQGGILATGSWDKTVKVCHSLPRPEICVIMRSARWLTRTLILAFVATKYWDTRSQAPVSVVQLPERCYTLDVAYPLLVVGTAERHILIYNLTNPTTPYKVRIVLGQPV